METFQHKVLEFDMPDEQFDPDFVPEDGAQYLQKVAYERKHCPAVVVRPFRSDQQVKPAGFSHNSLAIEPIDMSPSSLKPTIEWKNIQTKEFSRVRQSVCNLREKFLANPPESLPELPQNDEPIEWSSYCRTNLPLLLAMLQLDQRRLEFLLELLSEWLSAEAEIQEDPSASCIDLNASESWLGSWIYSILSCLHLPLEPNVHSVLRQIVRSCIRLRNGMRCTDIYSARPLNLLICIIAINFNQTDLAENV